MISGFESFYCLGFTMLSTAVVISRRCPLVVGVLLAAFYSTATLEGHDGAHHTTSYISHYTIIKTPESVF